MINKKSTLMLAGLTLLTFCLGRAPAGRAEEARAPLPSALRLTSQGDNLKPSLTARPAGGVYMAWAQKNVERSAILFARLRDGVHLDTPVQISTARMHLDLGAENGPSIALDAGGAIYVVWTAGSTPAPAVAAHSEVKAGAAGSKAHSGGHPPRPGSLNIWLAKSEDDGATFSAPVQVNDGADGPEHRFPSVGIDARGGVCVAWLDKRKKTASGDEMARVFFARSEDGGKTFGANVDATGGQTNPICHCCRVALTTDPTQGLLIAYRNDIQDIRDIYLVRSEDAGHAFSVPRPLERTNWNLPACPMDGPSLRVDTAGRLHACWMSGAAIDRKPLFGKTDAKDSKILYTCMDLQRHTIQEPVVLGAGHHPRLVSGANRKDYIVWHEQSSIMLASLYPDAKQKAKIVSLSDGKGIASYPSITVDSKGEICCAWQQLMPDDTTQIYISYLPGALLGEN